jgi:hypothetical protein
LRRAKSGLIGRPARRDDDARAPHWVVHKMNLPLPSRSGVAAPMAAGPSVRGGR